MHDSLARCYGRSIVYEGVYMYGMGHILVVYWDWMNTGYGELHFIRLLGCKLSCI